MATYTLKIDGPDADKLDSTTLDEILYRGNEVYGLDVEFTLTVKSEPAAPEAPCKFLFGIDDPFEDGGIYAWIVAEPLYRKTGYVDDSSTAHSALYGEDGRRRQFEDPSDKDAFEDQVWAYLVDATKGVLFGEGMESAWEGGINEGESRDEAVERIKATLIERGFVHEPKLDQ